LGNDFSGYVPYRAGDDVRHVDWPVYARTQTLQVRRYDDESCGRLVVLVDGSGSMDIGQPTKWVLARTLAIALCFVALRELHQVVVGIAFQETVRWLPPQHGVDAAKDVAEFLRTHRPTGGAHIGAAMATLPRSLNSGRLVILSDFLNPRGGGEDLAGLDFRGHELIVGRVSDPTEFDIRAPGIENPEGVGRLRIGGDLTDRLSTRVTRHLADLAASAEALQTHILELSTADGFPANIAGLIDRLNPRNSQSSGRAR